MMTTRLYSPCLPAMTLDYSVRNPLRHVLRAYDRAIHACNAGDAEGGKRAITLLRASHDGESPESLGFDGIFAWCDRALAGGDFAGPERRLTTLRNAWLDAAGIRGSVVAEYHGTPRLRLVRNDG